MPSSLGITPTRASILYKHDTSGHTLKLWREQHGKEARNIAGFDDVSEADRRAAKKRSVRKRASFFEEDLSKDGSVSSGNESDCDFMKGMDSITAR